MAQARHQSERYEIREIQRSEIQFAEYNPRSITDAARKKLKAAIEKVGLLGPVIWNKRTGRLVGGHQRLRALDAINGNGKYTLRVAEVDLSDADEKSANILLNNPEAQGEWDMEALGEMLKDPDLDRIASGMGSADIYRIIGEESSDEVLLECADRLEKAREISSKTKESAERYSTDFYLVVVFKDYAHRKSFTDTVGWDDNRYVSGEVLEQLAKDAAQAESK